MTTIIDVRHVSFSYGQSPVLDDVSLQIEEGEFFGIIGPNAAGKSTLLKLILGLDKPAQGHIRVMGETPGKVRSRIGYVPQHPSFRRDFPITVIDAVGLGQLGSIHKQKNFQAGLQTAMEAVELTGIAGRQISTLSGGQLQRVLIARALAGEPDILILDEPTANIDLRAEEDIFTLLKQYNDRMTIIVVSHDVAFISGYVHRVGCLNQTLICHRTGDISGKTIAELYGTPVRMIDHSH